MVGVVPRYGPRPDDFKKMAQYVSRSYANKKKNKCYSQYSFSFNSQPETWV